MYFWQQVLRRLHLLQLRQTGFVQAIRESLGEPAAPRP